MALYASGHLLVLISLLCACICFPNKNQSAAPSQKECTISCTYKVALTGIDYNECMFQCTNGNWLLTSGGPCTNSPNSFRQIFSASVCAPTNVKFHEVGIHNNFTDVSNGYLVLSWLACPAGIDDVLGFQVKFVDPHYFSNDCYNINLTKTLSNANRKTRFSILWPHKLSYEHEIHAIIRPLPITTIDDYKTYTYTTESCVNLNGIGTCACGLKGLRQSKTTAPKVTVRGYTLHVTMPVLKPCFRVTGYQLALTRKTPENPFFQNIEIANIHNPVGPFFNHTFTNVYNSPNQDVIKVTCTLITDEPQLLSSPTIHVKAWKPQPVVQVFSQGVIKVSFRPAADEFMITAYLVRLNSHPDAKFNNLSVPTTSLISNLSSSSLNNGLISTTYYDLQPSVYTVQVMEYRPPSDVFSEAEWSQPTEVVVKKTTKESDTVVVSVVLVTSLITLFVIVFVITLFLWKKGRCSKVRHYLPGHVTKWLDSQTISDISLRERTVFIVWKNDNRSQILSEKHAEIIRHLAAYLSRVCGLTVILDSLEEHIVSIGACSWIQNSLESAEFVLFICPHYSNDDDKIIDNNTTVVGDFNKIYRYLEPQLGDRKKYLTLLLPYSDPSCCKATKWLTNMTRSFKIMDQIEDLYFHIQEHSKVNLSGRHSVQYISSKDYHLTPEGLAFKECVNSFMEDSLSTDAGSSSGGSLVEENSEDALLEHQENPGDLTNHIGVIPPAPYMNCLPLTIQPPPLLVYNPDKHLKLMNGGIPVNQSIPDPLPVNQTHCPYHSNVNTDEGIQNCPEDYQVEFQPAPSLPSQSSFASMGSISSFNNSSGRNSALQELNIQSLATENENSIDLKEIEIMPALDSGFAESPLKR